MHYGSHVSGVFAQMFKANFGRIEVQISEKRNFNFSIIEFCLSVHAMTLPRTPLQTLTGLHAALASRLVKHL